jgi:hypothetical protein
MYHRHKLLDLNNTDITHLKVVNNSNSIHSAKWTTFSRTTCFSEVRGHHGK